MTAENKVREFELPVERPGSVYIRNRNQTTSNVVATSAATVSALSSPRAVESAGGFFARIMDYVKRMFGAVANFFQHPVVSKVMLVFGGIGVMYMLYRYYKRIQEEYNAMQAERDKYAQEVQDYQRALDARMNSLRRMPVYEEMALERFELNAVSNPSVDPQSVMNSQVRHSHAPMIHFLFDVLETALAENLELNDKLNAVLGSKRS
eukprot:TRINITY_DN5964_c0_g1_i1.p1 TRINITY_DN5964_c0_g1~~TRINITY_DN5964_c0_g1_i1.p1  ORF type:complete len:207 (+),score=15.79 TRINITY_DN5964_c0_g1_i1:81-701(+)